MADDAESRNSPENSGGTASSCGSCSPRSTATEAPLSLEPSASRARFSPPPLSSPRLPCAVCKHHQRRCGSRCPFAPHFPVDQPETFEKVLRLFTVKNLKDLMNKVGPSQHELFFRSIEYEAGTWAEDPVHGPIGVIRDLVDQLRNAFIEYVFVHIWLRLCVARAEQRTGRVRQAAAQEPNMVTPHAAAQQYNNRSAAQHSGTVTHGLRQPRQHQMTGARQAPAGANAAREQSMAMSRFGVEAQNVYDHNHPAAQDDCTPRRVTHGHGHGQLNQHQTTVQQMSVGHQSAAAAEEARRQNFQAAANAHAAPRSNSGAFVFQQQPPPRPEQLGTAPRYQQGQPSQPQSR